MMKLSIFFLCAMLSNFTPMCFAEDLPDDEIRQMAEAKPESVQKVEEKALVDLGRSQALSRLNDLESRIEAVERDQQFLEDRVRMLDRSVDDLRRRL
ncbi:MAG: hypothetical protein A2Z83_05600 [Omnitrophica bacterium GWA2_52_8]|nr:MAG: hypothetical protein A2Z83_05600 [Omnitrophica bacterium GWA2_52_8]